MNYRITIISSMLFAVSLIFNRHGSAISVNNHMDSANGGVKEKLEKAKVYVNNYKYDKALTLYRQALELDGNNFEAVWNTSFLLAEIGHNEKNIERKKDLFTGSEFYAKKAYRMQPDHPEANFVMAAVYGRKMEVADLKEKIKYAQHVKSFATKTVELDPKHGKAWLILGVWYYKFSNLSPLERGAAKLILGNDLNDANAENAVYALGQAVKYEPHRISFRYYYALALLETGQEEMAAEALKTAIGLPVRAEGDPGNKKKCRQLLQEIQV